jgi:hypothetical protein
METEGSSTCSQNPATGPYPHPLERLGQRKTYVKFGTPNVRSFYRSSSLTTVPWELPKYKLHLARVEEVRQDKDTIAQQMVGYKLRAAMIQVELLWVLRRHSVVAKYQRFRGPCRLHPEGQGSQSQGHFTTGGQSVGPSGRRPLPGLMTRFLSAVTPLPFYLSLRVLSYEMGLPCSKCQSSSVSSDRHTSVHSLLLLLLHTTPWCRILFEKLIVTQLVKKLFCFLMEPEGSLPCSQKPSLDPILSQLIQIAPSITISIRSILMLSSHLRLGLPSGLLPLGLPTKTL